MPIYEFSCTDCGDTFEKLLSSSEVKDTRCPRCGSAKIKKLISSGSIRSGSGGNSPGPIPAAPSCGGSGFS